MAYTETKTTGYGSRVASSFKGIGTGFILLAIATVLLWYNEGRAVHTAQDIKEVAKNATHVEDIQNRAPEGQLIHANGIAQTTDTVYDPIFKFCIAALSLERKVEYYQWVEHSSTETKEKLGGSQEDVTTYTYQCEWVSKPVDSEYFHDPTYRKRNKSAANLNIEDHTVYADRVTFGAYILPADFIPAVAGCAQEKNTPLNISPEVLREFNRTIGESQTVINHVVNNIDNTFTGNSNDSTRYDWVHVAGNQIYLGRNAGSPNVGDVRVTFTNRLPSAEISLIAIVKGDSFTQYKTKNKNNRRYITSGTKSLEEMMESEQESNETWTWILRVLGVIMVCLAFKMLFQILVTLLKVVPLVANILNWGVSIICYLLGIVYSLVIIAVAWIYYRPLLGVCLLALAGGVAGGLIYWGASRKKQAARQ